MELLGFEDVAKMFPNKNVKGIKNWLQTGVLSLDLTVKIGKNRYFVKEKLEAFIIGKMGE